MSCKKDEKKSEVSPFFVEIEPREGIYPQYSTFFVHITPNKDAEICYTVREKHNPKPCEREFVSRVKAEAGKAITVPVDPEFDEGATIGVFYLKVLARSKDGEEFFEPRRYEIILKPFITANPKGGFYPHEITVAVGCNKPCFLYYTLDGKEPKKDSAKKEEDGFILNIKNDTVLRVFAEDKVLGLRSDTVKEEYFIDTEPPYTEVIGFEDCKCEMGCEKKEEGQLPDAVRCDRPVTINLVGVDDKSPSIDIYWSVDGLPPSDNVENFAEAGGNTYHAKDSGDVPIQTHTILKFFSKDLAGNREKVRTLIVLVGDAPFAYATPPGGIYGEDDIPLEVSINTIPADAFVSYNLSFPDGTTSFVDSCSPPCKLKIEKEGRNILTYRAFKGNLADEMRRADYIIDRTPPRVFFEPANCFSDTGPISATIRSNEERVQVFWRICEKGIPGCTFPSCSTETPDVISGTAPVTDIVIEIPSVVFYCGIDQAGNISEIKKTECEVSGKHIEDFSTQDNMDEQNTTAEWGGGKLTLKRDSPEEEGGVDTAGGRTSDIDVRDKLAFIVDANSGVKIIDISSPTAPGMVAQVQITTAVSAELWNDILFVLTSDQLIAYDISNPRSVKIIGTASLPSDFSIPQNQANKIAVWGKYIVISAGNQGVVLVKITHEQTQAKNTVSFSRVGGITPSDTSANVFSRDIDVFGNLVAVAENEGGLRIVSVENPSAPSEITSYSDFLGSGEVAISIKFFFPYVAVGTNNGNVYIFDIRELPEVKDVSSILLSSGIPVNQIEHYGIFLVVADNQGIKFLDVREPSSPYLIYDLRRGGTTSIYLYGDRVLAGDINSGLFIYKIAEPFEEAYEMSVISSDAKNVDLVGMFASVLTSQGADFYVVENPFSPEFLTGISDVSAQPTASFLWGDKLFLGVGSKIRIYDILPSVSFIKELDLSKVRSGTTVREILGWGDTIFVAGEKAVFFIPVSDITNLTEDSIRKYNVDAYDIDISGDVLFVSTQDSRVVALRVLEGGTFSLLIDNLVSSSVYEIIPFGKYIITAQSISGLIFYDVSQIVYGRVQQIGAVALQNSEGVLNFGYFTLSLGDDSISLVDNTYVDRLREVYTAQVKAQRGFLFGDIMLAIDRDGEVKFVRFARSKVLYMTESKAQSINLTEDLKVPIKDASISTSFCETQDENCDKVGCSISFQVSNNGGLTWVDIPPNSGFFPFGGTGTSLMWRATLRSADPMITPELCRLTINYRFGR